MSMFICFDMNGVLIDDEKLHHISFQKALEKFYPKIVLTYSSYKDIFFGKTDFEGLQQFFKYYNICADKDIIPVIQQEKSRQYAYNLDNTSEKNKKELIISECLELIKQLKSLGHYCALVTGSAEREVKKVLAIMPLDSQAFNIILTKESYEKSKPHPEPYLTACKALAKDPADALVIEDSPSGVSSAIAAGCQCIAITTTHNKEELKHATWVTQLCDLKPLVFSILS